MPDSLSNPKRKTIEKRLADLSEEYEAANKQLSRTLDDVDRLRLQRRIKDLEQEIQRTEGELGQLELTPTAPVTLSDKPTYASSATTEGPKSPRRLRVFLCHASGDKPAVRDLCHRLRADGVDPWLDEEKLMAGQDWQLEIKKAVRSSDVVIVCLSRESTTKAGYVQKEIKYALDVAEEQPEGSIFLIPLKLEECEVPIRLRDVHWVNFFEKRSYEKLMRALHLRAEKIGRSIEPSLQNIHLGVTLSRRYCPVTYSEQLMYALVEVIPVESLHAIQVPLNLSLVLECSDSMAGQRLNDVKAAVRLAIDRMTPQDIISVVVFNDKANVVVPAQRVTDPQGLKQQIDAIMAGNSSMAMLLGMRKGLDELRKSLSPRRVSCMILLNASETFSDKDECRALATDIRNAGASVSALGLGVDWNEDVLDAIAGAGGGISDFIEKSSDIPKFFGQLVQSMQATTIRNARMVLHLVSGVSLRQAWRVSPFIGILDSDPLSTGDEYVSLGDLGRGQMMLLELRLPAHQTGIYRLAQIEVIYDVVPSGAIAEKVTEDIVIIFTSETALATQVNHHVMNIVEKVTCFRNWQI